MKKSSKSLLMCMLITGICAGSAQGVFAEEKIGEFNLDQMVVTASRLEESNFEANANVNVVTRKDIEEKHYQTVMPCVLFRALPSKTTVLPVLTILLTIYMLMVPAMFLFWWTDRERTPMVLHLAYSNLPK